MASEKDLSMVMDTILSIPGMNETVKLDFKISRKNILFLSSLIEWGVTAKGSTSGSLIGNIPPEEMEHLKLFSEDCLNKAGLKELNEKLKGLLAK